MSKTRKSIIEAIKVKEGGSKYTNNPNDRGGETRWGITRRTAEDPRYKKVWSQFGFNGDMKTLPEGLADYIYNDFWDQLRLDHILPVNVELAERLMDTGVNRGIGAAGKMFQRCLNVLNDRQKHYPDIKVDGDVGDKTIRAFDAFIKLRKERGSFVLLFMTYNVQASSYLTISENDESQEEFTYGWFDRVYGDLMKSVPNWK